MNHRLGFNGHRIIEPYLQQSASAANLHIIHQGGLYTVTINERNESGAVSGNISTLCPDYIPHINGRFEKAEDLDRFLRFLHQPVRSTFDRQFPNKADRKIAQDMTHGMRLMLRKLTGGSYNASSETENGETAIHDDHHEVVESRMDAEISRETNREIGNDTQTRNTVPASHADPRHGFVFTIHENSAHDSQTDQGLKKFADLLHTATGKTSRLEAGQALILKADELAGLCRAAAKDPEFLQTVHRARQEENFQNRLASVERRLQDLSKSPDFLLEKSRASGVTPSERAARLRLATSTSLTPAIQHDAAASLWILNNYSDHDLSAFEKALEECAHFQRMLNLLEERAQKQAGRSIGVIELEAIAQEFYGLTAFAKDLTAALDKKESSKSFGSASLLDTSLSTEAMDPDYRKILDMVKTARGQNGSPAMQLGKAGIESSIAFVKDISSILRESRKNQIAFVALASFFYISFGMDASEADRIVNEAFANADGIGVAPDGSLTILPPDPSAAQDIQAKAEAAKMGESCHWQPNGIKMVKHCIYDSVVTNATISAMMMLDDTLDKVSKLVPNIDVNPNPVFTKVWETIPEPLSDALFKVNLYLQNPIHAALWLSLLTKAAQHGPKGGRQLADMLAPITNAGHQLQKERPWALGSAALSSIAGYLYTPEIFNLVEGDPAFLSQRLGGAFLASLFGGAAGYAVKKTDRGKSLGEHIISDVEDIPAAFEKYPEHIQQELLRGVKAAQTVEDTIRKNIPDHIKSAEFKVRIGGLKRDFNINAKNYEQTLNALTQFDLLVEHAGDQIGIREPWYRQLTQSKIRDVRQALEAFQESGNTKALQEKLNAGLEDIMGIQMRQTGSAALYHALFNQESNLNPTEQSGRIKKTRENFAAAARQNRIITDLKHIKRHGTALYGHRKRMNKISEYSLRVPPKQQTLGTDIANSLVSAWDDLVSTVRWTQKQIDKVPKNKWSGGATAALLLSAVALDRTGQSQILLGEHFGAASDMLSGITSAGTTSLINLGTFLNYNFWEDIVGYDLIGGGTAFSAGLAYYYANKHAARPAICSALERYKPLKPSPIEKSPTKEMRL